MSRSKISKKYTTDHVQRPIKFPDGMLRRHGKFAS
jgi:hypothetical protein